MSKIEMMNRISTLSRERDELLTLQEKAVHPKMKEAIDRELQMIGSQADKIQMKMRDAK